MLREAVRSLLTRRDMEYTIQRGKGSFLVNATSGHEFVGNSSTEFNAVDSKVIVTTNEFCDNPVRHDGIHRPQRVPPSVPSSSSTTTAITAILECTPTPAEVAADDALMERIKTKSAQEHAQSIQDEQRELSKAISISKQEVDKLQQEEEEQLKAILQQSQHERLRQQEEEEKQLTEALLRSQEDEDDMERRNNDSSMREADDERVLAAVLQASQEEENAMREEELLQLQRAISISQLDVKMSSQHDNDQALQQALAQSMQDM